MKQQMDKNRSNRQFDIDDMVYVKLQPYKQSIVVNRKCLQIFLVFIVS